MATSRYGKEHQRARAAAVAAMRPGQPCARCHHGMWPGDKVDLDHRDDGAGYLGLSHSSPCRVCGKRCNQSAGGRKGASAAGKDLAAKRCLICGKPFESTLRDGSTGKPVATCGQRACISALRKLRKDRQPDPQPPDTTGRAWLPPLIRAR